MSKVATVVGTGFAGSGLFVGGAYMMGMFGGGGDGMTLPLQLDKFKEIGNKHCVDNYFSRLKLSGGTSAKLEKSFFPTSSDSQPQPKSCLLINWHKQTHQEEDKWNGNFRWLWTFVQGDHGFVMFTSADADKATSPQLNLTGGIYFVKKEKNEWKVDKYQEIPKDENNKKQISKTDFGTKFPSVGEAITDKDKFKENKEHWGFVSSNGDFDKICATTDAEKCKEGKIKSQDWFRGRWEWEPSTDTSKKKITDWGKNWNAWFSNMYGTDAVDFSTFFDSMHGQWTNRHMSPNQPKP